MLEIIALFILGKKIKKITNEKGLNATKYILTMVSLWILFEFVGVFIYVSFFGQDILMLLFGLCWAALGGYFSYVIAVNAPPQEAQN